MAELKEDERDLKRVDIWNIKVNSSFASEK